MCTAITLKSIQKENFFGRTMDFSHDIDPGVYIMPKNYEWKSLGGIKSYTNTYSFIAIGQKTDGILAFFDGVNEKGFAAASLYFAGYADYNLPSNNKEEISSLDFLHYILGTCGSLKDLKAVIKNINIIGGIDPVTNSAAPLHWIASDKSGGCVVIEQTKSGLKMINNPIGVMANSPDFNWHMTNLRNYMNLSTSQQSEVFWDSLSLKPFGQGGGSVNLPGGFTSPERFVRTAFLKTHINTPKSRSEAIMSCFHIMNNVFIPKGLVVTDRETYDYTKYVAFINTNTCEYFFKTYDNNTIKTVRLWDYYKKSDKAIFLGSIKK